MPPKVPSSKNMNQSVLEREIAAGAAALDDSLKPLWSLFDKRLKTFESDIKRNYSKIKEMDARL